MVAREDVFMTVPLHEKTIELIELVGMPGILESQTLGDIHRIMAECRYIVDQSSSLHHGCGAFLVTSDHRAVFLNIDPRGTYSLNVDVADTERPTKEEIAYLRKLQAELAGWLAAFHQGPKFVALLEKVGQQRNWMRRLFHRG